MRASDEINELIGKALNHKRFEDLPKPYLLNNIKTRLNFKLSLVIQIDDTDEYKIKKLFERLFIKYNFIDSTKYDLPTILQNEEKYLINIDLYGSSDEFTLEEFQLYFTYPLVIDDTNEDTEIISHAIKTIKSITIFIYPYDVGNIYTILNGFQLLENIGKFIKSSLYNLDSNIFISIRTDKDDFENLLKIIKRISTIRDIYTSINNVYEEFPSIELMNPNILDFKIIIDSIVNEYTTSES